MSLSGFRTLKALPRHLRGANCEASTPTRTATTAELFLVNAQLNTLRQLARSRTAYGSG